MAHIDWQAVYNYFLENTITTLADTAQHFNINVDYVRQVAAKEGWTAKKLQVQQMATRVMENMAVEQIVKRNEEMAKMGRVLQGLGMEAIAEKQMKPTNYTEARKSIEAGIKIERQALNMDKNQTPSVAIQQNFNNANFHTIRPEGIPFEIRWGNDSPLDTFVYRNGMMEKFKPEDTL